MKRGESISNCGNDMQVVLARLQRDVRLLKAYAASVTIAVVLIILCGANWTDRRQKFEEMDVERINIVEPDGRLALVLANTPRLPGPIVSGKERKTGRTGPGILFFNGRGDECGGLAYGSQEKDGRFEASAHFSFDQYKNDQVVYLNYHDDGTTRTSGLYVVDRPQHPNVEEFLQQKDELERASGAERERLERQMRDAAARGEYGAQRIFVGSANQTAMVRLRDTAGRNRVRLFVDAGNSARLEFLDEQGKVVYSIPPN